MNDSGNKKALCVGINDYPFDGSDLNGCVNDSLAWADVLVQQYGFPRDQVKLLHDAQATKAHIMRGLEDLLAGARQGDTLVFTNSSHGSYVADRDGDEETYDEVLCPYDVRENHIKDDELRELFSNVPDGVHLAVVLDNCHSGTATRAAVSEIIPGLRTPDDRRVRFLSPALRGGRVLQNPWAARPRGAEKHPMSKMKEVLLSGCTDKEYSYDAFVGDRHQGVMTYFALKALKEASYRLTYAQLHERLGSLITEFPQHPQLEGSRENTRRGVFGS